VKNDLKAEICEVCLFIKPFFGVKNDLNAEAYLLYVPKGGPRMAGVGGNVSLWIFSLG